MYNDLIGIPNINFMLLCKEEILSIFSSICFKVVPV